MPELETARHQLPQLAVSQAQKEITYNSTGADRCVASEGMRIRLLSSGLDLAYIDGPSVSPPAIPNPAGGAMIDVEARAAITALPEHLRALEYVTN
jgi:hypothetical protein